MDFHLLGFGSTWMRVVGIDELPTDGFGARVGVVWEVVGGQEHTKPWVMVARAAVSEAQFNSGFVFLDRLFL